MTIIISNTNKRSSLFSLLSKDFDFQRLIKSKIFKWGIILEQHRTRTWNQSQETYGRNSWCSNYLLSAYSLKIWTNWEKNRKEATYLCSRNRKIALFLFSSTITSILILVFLNRYTHKHMYKRSCWSIHGYEMYVSNRVCTVAGVQDEWTFAGDSKLWQRANS